MRPIERGNSPHTGGYTNYRDAFASLVSRLGHYCSYCERKIATNLAVEHIQPKGLPQYQALVGRWDNFLLGCINCNSTKGDKDVALGSVLLPDRDNTVAAYDYTPDGKVAPARGLSGVLRTMAADTLALCGLDKGPSQVKDENGKLVAIDRYAQRIQAWGIALMSRDDLSHSPTEGMRRQIVRTIWMQVFDDDPKMRQMLIEGFSGTARDCFDANMRPVTPRPPNGLPHGSKV
jgi:uncharacterized protein (TIGR02646 family)